MSAEQVSLESEISLRDQLAVDNQRTIRVPDVIAPEECAERCRKLAEKTGEAALKAICAPSTKYAVICDNAARIGCNAQVLQAGFFLDADGQEVYYPNAHRSLRITSRTGLAYNDVVTAEENGAARIPLSSIRKPSNFFTR